MTKTIVERFVIGGRNGHPSMPSDKLQRALGAEIQIDISSQTLCVPTDNGMTKASKGDTIVCYDDGSYDVERGEAWEEL
jgi:hypothetical protein